MWHFGNETVNYSFKCVQGTPNSTVSDIHHHPLKKKNIMNRLVFNSQKFYIFPFSP